MAQSLAVTQLVKRFEHSTAVYEAHGKVIAAALDERIKDDTQADEGAASKLLYQYHTMAKASLEKVMHSDAAVVRELRESQKALGARDQEIESSRTGTIRLKESLNGIYGPTLAEDLGLSGETPRDATSLLQLLTNTHTILESKKELPSPLEQMEGMPSWSLKALRKRVSQLLEPLKQAVAAAKTESKEDQQAQIQRRQDIEDARRQVISFDALLEAFARSTHNDEVARSVRPAGRSSRASADNPIGTPAEPPTPPSPSVSPTGS